MEPWISVLNKQVPLKAHAYRADDIQYLSICAGLAVKCGLAMEEGLKAIKINAAYICRVDSKAGNLKRGKYADMAIFDGNPMEVFTNTLYTIIDGEIIYENVTK